MTEIFQEAIKGYNLPLTILLGLIVLYWVITMFGLIDHDSIDGALGLDTGDGHDFGHDGDAGDAHGGDSDGHGHSDDDGLDDSSDGDASSSDGNVLHAILRFLGVGDAPLMFVLSVFVLFLWCGNVFANLYFNEDQSSGRANLMLLIVFVSAFILTKLIIRPLRPLMKLMRTNEVHKPMAGQAGTVRSKQLTEEFGQVEVIQDGASVLLNARLSEGCDPVLRGSEVLVVAKDDEKDLYIARPISPDSTNPST